jgi:DNA-binding transcriptional regulator YiaG
LDNRIALSTLARWETTPQEPSMSRRDWAAFCNAVGVPFDQLPLDMAVTGTRRFLTNQSPPCRRQQQELPQKAVAQEEPLSVSLSREPSLVTLLDLRRRAGLSQNELAEELNKRFRTVGSDRTVLQKNISDWEAGRCRPKLAPVEFVQMAESLSCSLSVLQAAIGRKTDLPKSSSANP